MLQLVSKYTKTLFLLYIKDVGHDYSFSEAKELLGITQNQLDHLLNNLLQEGLLVYEKYSLTLTKKALRQLISQNELTYRLREENVYTNTMDIRAFSIDEPYVPCDFDKKYSLTNR